MLILFFLSFSIYFSFQLLDPHAVHGVSPYMDMTEEEFESKMMGMKSGNDIPRGYEGHVAPLLPTTGLPEEWNWADKGAVTG